MKTSERPTFLSAGRRRWSAVTRPLIALDQPTVLQAITALVSAQRLTSADALALIADAALIPRISLPDLPATI